MQTVTLSTTLNKQALSELKLKIGACFDEEGAVRLCGREHCKDLITFLDNLTGTQGQFGDVLSGCMNTKNIFDYIQPLGLLHESK